MTADRTAAARTDGVILETGCREERDRRLAELRRDARTISTRIRSAGTGGDVPMYSSSTVTRDGARRYRILRRTARVIPHDHQASVAFVRAHRGPITVLGQDATAAGAAAPVSERSEVATDGQ